MVKRTMGTFRRFRLAAVVLAVTLLMAVPVIPFSSATGAVPVRDPVASPSGDPVPSRGSTFMHIVPNFGTSLNWEAECGFATVGALTCANSPLRTTFSSAAFDNKTGDQYFVVFGGESQAGAATNGTYEWNKGNWSTVVGNGWTNFTNPKQAFNVSMTYDGTDNYVLAVDGWNPGTGMVSQTYTFASGAWTKQTAPGFAAQAGSCLAWVPVVSGHGGYVILFGGGTKTQLESYTWKYLAGTWTNITASVSTAPAARTNSQCYWNNAASKLDLFGGFGGSNNALNDLWTFDPTLGTTGQWAQVIANGTVGSPPGRQMATFWYDSQTGKMDLSGGAKANFLKLPTSIAGGQDTWTLVGSTWSNITGSVTRLGSYQGGVFGTAHAYSANYAYGWQFGGSISGSATNVLVSEFGYHVVTEMSVAPPFPQLNQTFWLNTTTAGGTGVYAYNWTGLPAGSGCAIHSSVADVACTPTTGGVYNVTVYVTDSAGSPFPGVVLSANVTLTLPAPAPAAVDYGTVALSGLVATHVANRFFGEVGNPQLPENWTNYAYSFGQFYNSSALYYSRNFAGGQGFDPTADVNWVAPTNGGTFVHGSLQFNETQFKANYNSLPLSKRNLLAYLPAQANSTSFAVYTAMWFHTTYGIKGNITWQFGNEPDAWIHYGENFSAWATTDNSKATAIAYATMAANYATAVHAVYPNDTFIGIEASSAYYNNVAFIEDTIEKVFPAVGSALVGEAYHDYPTPNATNPYGAIGAYYSSATNIRGLPATIAQLRSLYVAACGGNASCLAQPTSVGEYNGGPSSNLSAYNSLYPGAVYAAAAVVFALDYNLTTFQLFQLGNLYKTGVVLPSGLLYQRVLQNMTLGKTYFANATGTGVTGSQIYGTETTNGTRASLLLVNMNMTHSDILTLPAGYAGSAGRIYTWSPGASVPVSTVYWSLPQTVNVSAQGIVLVNDFNGTVNPVGGVLTGVALGGLLVVVGLVILGSGGGYLMATKAGLSRPSRAPKNMRTLPA